MSQVTILPWNNIRKYSVDHFVEVTETANAKKSQVSYDLELSCMRIFKNGNMVWNINRTNYKINGEFPDSPHMKLVVGLEASIFPLQLDVNSKGQFVRITNHRFWLRDWKLKIAEEINSFEGAFAHDFYTRFSDELATDKATIQKLFGQALFLVLFPQIQASKLKVSILKCGVHEFDCCYIQNCINDDLIQETLQYSDTADDSISQQIREVCMTQGAINGKWPGDLVDISIDAQNIYEKANGMILKKKYDLQLNDTDGQYVYNESFNLKFEGTSKKTSNPRNELQNTPNKHSNKTLM